MFNIWLVIYLALTLIGIGIVIADGDREPAKKITELVSAAIVLWILYMAGLFDLLVL